MLAGEFGLVMDTLGWSSDVLGDKLGCTFTECMDWRAGRVPVPQHVSEYLRVVLLTRRIFLSIGVDTIKTADWSA